VLTGGVDVEALMRGFIEVLRSKYRSVEGSCRRSVTISSSLLIEAHISCDVVPGEGLINIPTATIRMITVETSGLAVLAFFLFTYISTEHEWVS
jgi:hypothetical protein